MLMSSGSTVLYLGGHMRRMVANGQSLSCPQLRNQLRVTVTGILQGVLYTFCAIWITFSAFPGGIVFNILSQLFYLVMVCGMYTSMTSSVWLNFFYCCQIVPAKRAFFIWMKKNVKSIIYCICNNSTEVHFACCFCVMLMSSGSTVLYLGGHMRRMVANGQCMSCPQLRNQLRVTVTGILQGVLYTFCAIWTAFNDFPGGELLVRLYSGREQHTSGLEQLSGAKHLTYNRLKKKMMLKLKPEDQGSAEVKIRHFNQHVCELRLKLETLSEEF
ncbi:uncharacterized protein LOC130202084 [Pseudoliparis swirei]|uniref:uncharacterized protein LOC130202084 n=1 Tax=Pseudoliparis swirei TaxID=2059687 RepID=UPI0024BD6ECF|nr:uncharacterized protein LOC130202084 [Pseudoliparis swirei]